MRSYSSGAFIYISIVAFVVVEKLAYLVYIHILQLTYMVYVIYANGGIIEGGKMSKKLPKVLRRNALILKTFTIENVSIYYEDMRPELGITN